MTPDGSDGVSEIQGQGQPIQSPRKRGPKAPLGLNHRDGGICPALQLAGQLMCFGHGHEADLFDGLTATAQGDIVALMAKGLDANCFAEAKGLLDRHASPGHGFRSWGLC